MCASSGAERQHAPDRLGHGAHCTARRIAYPVDIRVRKCYGTRVCVSVVGDSRHLQSTDRTKLNKSVYKLRIYVERLATHTIAMLSQKRLRERLLGEASDSALNGYCAPVLPFYPPTLHTFLSQDAGIARLLSCRSPLTSLNVSYGGPWLTGSTLGLLHNGAATLRELHVGSLV